MATNKNWGIGRFVSCWWNEGQDGKPGYWTINIRRKYKDKTGVDVEEKISMFASDAIQLATELQAAVNKILTHPREIVRREQPVAMPDAPDAPIGGDDIPF